MEIVLSSVLVDNPDIEEKIVGASQHNLTFVPNDDNDRFKEVIKKIDGVVTADKPITAEMIESMENCRVIVRQGIGFDSIDLEAASKKGIVVCNIPDYCVEEVSDFTVGLLLCCARQIVNYDRHTKSGVWDVNSVHSLAKMPPLRRMSYQTIGIVGFGRIARLVAKKAKAFGAKILAYDPYVDEEKMRAEGVEKASLEDLLKESDLVALNLPLTDETYHMIDKDALDMMKPTAYLINTGRGPLVDQEAIVEALKNKTIAGAALDVLEHEPPEENSELFGLDNLILTPHAAFFTQDSFVELRERAIEEAVRVLDGKAPLNPVNKI